MKQINSLSLPDRQAKVLESVRIVTNSGQYANGFHVYKLQKVFHTRHDGGFSIAFNSCGSALFAAFRYYQSIGVRTVAIQNNTAYATGAMALEAGLNIHVIDSSPNCPSMGVDSLRSALQDDKTIGLVCITHAGGFIACDYASIADLCMEKGLPLMEDAANAVGDYKGFSRPGRYGDVTCFSFGMASSLPCGTGGMMVTKDPEVRNYARKFVDYGKYVEGVKLKYDRGFNLGISEYEAAVALIQLEALPAIVNGRAADFASLQSIAPCLLDPLSSNYARYPIDASLIQKLSLAPGMYASGDQLSESLKAKNVTYRNLPHSFRWAQNHRCLPVGEGLYVGMDAKDIVKALTRP